MSAAGGGGGHSHTQGCSCDHDDDGDGESLLPVIELDRVSALNERVRGSARGVFREFENRHVARSVCESNAGDPDLIISIPFTSSVRVKSISVLGATEGTTPRDLHIYVNRDDIDFAMADETPAAQTLALSVDPGAALFYPLRAARFANVSSLTLVFRGAHGGGESSAVAFVGLKGVVTGHRRGVVTAVYESRPMPQDHTIREGVGGGASTT